MYNQTHFLWFATYLLNGKNHWILCRPDQVNKIASCQVTEVLLALIASAVIQQTKDGRATDSCFVLIWAHRCGVLMLNAVCLLEN